MMDRPDLTGLPPEIIAYIDYLEAQLEAQQRPAAVAAPEPSEPPTTVQLITISRSGQAKRTPRHLYGRQRRGGMGVFDLDVAEDDEPAVLTLADLDERLLLFSNEGRGFRIDVRDLQEEPVRGRGASLRRLLPLRDGERIVAALPAGGGAYIILASERGWVRRVRSSFFAGALIPGTTFHEVASGGPLAAACWSPGDADLFIVTRQGMAIRFSESQVSGRTGALGLRVAPGDAVVGVTPVYEDGGAFIADADGQGTIRLMSGFRPNKSPGAASKQAMKSAAVIGAVSVAPEDDLFLISRLGKIIRFSAGEVPAKESAVQGVNCMTLRADATTALAAARL
jgi:DNA gyrase subunit A